MTAPEPPPALWGEQTALAVANFPVSGEPVPGSVIRWLAAIKAEAARVNAHLGVLDPVVADAVRRAADEVAAGAFADQFPVDVFQTGSGTSTNMNVNEVVAGRARQLTLVAVHPNDHVNASQSSNDAFPSAVRIAAYQALAEDLLPALTALAATLRRRAAEHARTVKLGRTHLMDAVPMTFGQELGGWARAVELDVRRLTDVLPRLAELPLGGTAVGTGLNAPPGFARAVVAGLAARSGLPLVEAVDHFEAQGMQDVCLEVSGACKVTALTLHKIAGDLRLLASGPTAGLAEIELPALQAGSSIMPGKVNPVICEAVQQVAAQVVGNDAAITFAGTASVLQLSTAMPVIARNLLGSVRLLANVTTLLDRRCVAGMVVHVDRMRRYAESSPALVTALAPRIGYDAAARLAHLMAETGRPLAALLAEQGIDGAGIDDLLRMTGPEPAP